MKKKNLKMAFAALVIVTMISVLAACGPTVSAELFGKSFAYKELLIGSAYNNTIDDDIGFYTSESRIEMSLPQIDWKRTLDDEDFDETVTTVEKAKELLEAYADKFFSEVWEGVKIVFGSKEEMTVAIGEYEYDLVEETPLYYGVYRKADTEKNNAVAYISYNTSEKGDKITDITISETSSSDASLFRLTVDIYLSGEESAAFSIFYDALIAEVDA